MNLLNWKHDEIKKWLLLAFFIRLLLFVYFTTEFNNNWPANLIRNKFVIVHNDSSGYYEPMKSWADGHGYSGACRMPGLLPIYARLRLFTGESGVLIATIVLQFLTGIIAVYFLARASYILFQSERLFKSVFFIFALSSFISIWDHFLISESFSISFLVFSCYFIARFYQSRHWKFLLWSGAFFAWSVFIRPTHILLAPTLGLFLFFGLSPVLSFPSLVKLIKRGLLLFLPVALALAAWCGRNYREYHRFILLQDEDHICFGTLSEHHVALRNMIIAWGDDYKEWSTGTELSWFMDKNLHSVYHFDNRYLSPTCTLDSLQVLKEKYTIASSDTADKWMKKSAQAEVIAMTARLTSDYKKEHPLDYYLINRMRLFQLFVFPGKVENLPLPAINKMNPIQYAVKAGYSALFTVVNFLYFVALAFAVIRKERAMLALLTFPLILIFVLVVIFGYAEQRYITPAYPIMAIGACFVMVLLSDRRKKRLLSRKKGVPQLSHTV
ncbi:MAG: glycosyltransferase family 39 protein [Crocinitomicaceae bacterium]|nr:glycosyltransferase family 39 protein [Crocinitomicaceae bacterium]